ncbi:MAG: amidohydrolase family protein, partial [Staphylothermus sp.]|nr:amidohydrolase family protein [Staphylothermus sp.]
ILSPRYHAVHAVNVSPEEIKYIAETGAHVIHNPESNMYLGSGIAPIPEYMEAGVNVALATDGAGSNNNNDMIEAMRFAVFLHRAAKSHPSIITAWDALEMATINGAKALGLENEIGSLEPGKKADITIIKLDAPHTAPVHDPLGAIVYCANAQDVDTVIVDGRILMENRVVKIFDEEKVKEEAYKAAERILDRAREKFDTKFPFEKFLV